MGAKWAKENDRNDKPEGPMSTRHGIAPRQSMDRSAWACIVQSARRCTRHSHVHVDQYRLADPLNLGYDAFEVKRLCEHDFEDLLHVDRSGCRAKDE